MPIGSTNIESWNQILCNYPNLAARISGKSLPFEQSFWINNSTLLSFFNSDNPTPHDYTFLKKNYFNFIELENGSCSDDAFTPLEISIMLESQAHFDLCLTMLNNWMNHPNVDDDALQNLFYFPYFYAQKSTSPYFINTLLNKLPARVIPLLKASCSKFAVDMNLVKTPPIPDTHEPNDSENHDCESPSTNSLCASVNDNDKDVFPIGRGMGSNDNSIEETSADNEIKNLSQYKRRAFFAETDAKNLNTNKGVNARV